jgi:hypothetical protein
LEDILTSETETESFGELLNTLASIEEEAHTTELDPATVIGEIKEKVDSTKFVIDGLLARSKEMKAHAEEFMKAAKSLENNAKRFKEYIAFCMSSQDYEKLPGDRWYVRLMEKKTKTPNRTPTQHDAIKMEGLVKREVSYKWDSKALIESVENGSTDPSILDTKTTKYIRYFANTKGSK